MAVAAAALAGVVSLSRLGDGSDFKAMSTMLTQQA